MSESIYDELTKPVNPEGDNMVDEVNVPVVPVDDGKSLVESKTFWFNVITVGLTVLTYLVDSPILEDNASAVAILTTIIGVGNVILRVFTGKTIKSVTPVK